MAYLSADDLPAPVKTLYREGFPGKDYASISPSSDSVSALREMLSNRKKIFQLVDDESDAQMIVEYMGLQHFPGDFQHKDLNIVWITVTVGEYKYNYLGFTTHGADAYDAALSLLESWVKKNYLLIQQAKYIPGGTKSVTYPWPTDSKSIPRAGYRTSGSKVKIFCGVGVTPADYDGTWGSSKDESLKDIKSAISGSNWFELVNNKADAELVLEILGRAQGLGGELIWTEVSGKNIKGTITGSYCGNKSVTRWTDAAQDTVRELELWTKDHWSEIRPEE